MFDRTAAQQAHNADRKVLEEIRAARESGTDWADIAVLDGDTPEEKQASWQDLMERVEERIKSIRENDEAQERVSAELSERMNNLLDQSIGAPPVAPVRSNENLATSASVEGTTGAVRGSDMPVSHATAGRLTFAQHIREQIGNPGHRSGGMVELKLPVTEKPDMRNFFNPDDARERFEQRQFERGQAIHMGETRAVDTTNIATSHTQQMGIVTDRAEYYASGRIPMVYADEMRTRGDQWNESDTTVGTPTVTFGETDTAVEYSPTTIERKIYPADSRIVIKVSKRSLMNRSDWEDYLQFKLMQKFWEITSPEFVHSGSNLTGLLGVGNAAFHQSTTNTNPVLNPMNGITKKAYSITASEGKGVAIANAVGDALDDMSGLAPGPKEILCRRQFASAYRRDLGTAFGVALQRSGMMNLDIEGAMLAPVDVGFESEAANKLQAVISDFSASTEFLISWLEVQILYETAAKTGQLEFVLNIGRAFRLDSRFQYGLIFAAA